MLSTQDNELLCRVGPGTPMGEFMREYWLPAFVPSELPEADGEPRRMRLLGENLIAFRVSSGKYGLIANNCPHRGASLFFGRNEEEGIRCVYHGWKFDVGGQCIDMPNEPAESDFKTKVKATAYPCVERNGIVWTYMGPRDTPPPLPIGCLTSTPTVRCGCDYKSPTGYKRSRQTPTRSTPSSCTPATSALRRVCRVATRTSSHSSATVDS